MIVVADTSPLNYLVLLGKVNVLETLYGRVLLPKAVHRELLSIKAPAVVRAWATGLPDWCELLPESETAIQLPGKLHAGEKEAIAMAELLRADWLLIDETAGRSEAVHRGLQTIGTLGILRESHRAGLLNLTPTLVELQQLGFHVSQSLIQALLASI